MCHLVRGLFEEICGLKKNADWGLAFKALREDRWCLRLDQYALGSSESDCLLWFEATRDLMKASREGETIDWNQWCLFWSWKLIANLKRTGRFVVVLVRTLLLQEVLAPDDVAAGAKFIQLTQLWCTLLWLAWKEFLCSFFIVEDDRRVGKLLGCSLCCSRLLSFSIVKYSSQGKRCGICPSWRGRGLVGLDEFWGETGVTFNFPPVGSLIFKNCG